MHSPVRHAPDLKGTGATVDDGIRLTDEQRLDWLRLIRSENVGPRTFRALVNHYGGARAALDALPELARRGGAARTIRVYPRADAEREIAAAERLGAIFVASGEPAYPQRLAAIDDAPPLLAVRGNRDALARPMVAIVGSRNASAAGIKFAERLAHDLGRSRLRDRLGARPRHRCGRPPRQPRDRHRRGARRRAGSHLSGRARGRCSTRCSRKAPRYPRCRSAWEPRARDFPRRNRLISGLSLGVVIVEAAKRSGSLITARFALEQGREVFAVPGSPLDPRAEGTNGLLKQGATLVTEAADVIAVLEPILGRTPGRPVEEPELHRPTWPASPIADARARIVALLGPTPVGIDDLVRLSGAPPGIVRIVLLELEIAGRLERQGGGLVSLA